jgi:acyl-CoA thioester hydrolase
MSLASRDDFALLHPLRVRWNECDIQGIVFNVNYFLYYDIAVWEWTRALGFEMKDAPEFVTAHAECDFLDSARFDEELLICMRAARLGEKSMDMAAAVFRGGDLLNMGKLTYVHVTKNTVEKSPIPDAFKGRVCNFERTPPELARRR